MAELNGEALAKRAISKLQTCVGSFELALFPSSNDITRSCITRDEWLQPLLHQLQQVASSYGDLDLDVIEKTMTDRSKLANGMADLASSHLCAFKAERLGDGVQSAAKIAKELVQEMLMKSFTSRPSGIECLSAHCAAGLWAKKHSLPFYSSETNSLSFFVWPQVGGPQTTGFSLPLVRFRCELATRARDVEYVLTAVKRIRDEFHSVQELGNGAVAKLKPSGADQSHDWWLPALESGLASTTSQPTAFGGYFEIVDHLEGFAAGIGAALRDMKVRFAAVLCQQAMALLQLALDSALSKGLIDNFISMYAAKVPRGALTQAIPMAQVSQSEEVARELPEDSHGAMEASLDVPKVTDELKPCGIVPQGETPYRPSAKLVVHPDRLSRLTSAETDRETADQHDDMEAEQSQIEDEDGEDEDVSSEEEEDATNVQTDMGTRSSRHRKPAGSDDHSQPPGPKALPRNLQTLMSKWEGVHRKIDEGERGEGDSYDPDRLQVEREQAISDWLAAVRMFQSEIDNPNLIPLGSGGSDRTDGTRDDENNDM